MNKEQQDLSWACLPKEVREEMKGDYSQEVEDDTDKGYNLALRAFFGHHNLTSDTEPEELVHIKRSTLIDRYASYSKESDNIKNNEPYLQFCEGRLNALANLFGNKCLPDKEESVQVEPKFKKDEVVRSKSTNKVLKIYSNCAEIEKSSCLCVDEDGLVMSFPINDLEPYTEPSKVESKFKVGDKVKIWINSYGKVYDRIIKTIKSVRLNNDNVFVYSFFDYDLELDEHHFEPYAEPETKEPECIHPDSDNCKWKNICDRTQCYFDPINSETKDMEENKIGEDSLYPKPSQEEMVEEFHKSVTTEPAEIFRKELNLCELLKGCEEEEFYCPYLRNNVKFIGFDECDGMTFILSLYKDGLGYENLMYIKKNENIGKSFVLYPSKELYEKYPLDAKKAWMEWAETRKPKRWRAEEGNEYWYLSAFVIPEITSDNLLNGDDKLY